MKYSGLEKINNTGFAFFLMILSMVIAPASLYAVSVYHLFSYNFPKNESYVDTIKNEDIYWNPNSGFQLSLGVLHRFRQNFEVRLEGRGTFGYDKYPTTDGRKVNTEAEAENVPATTNTEWSRIFSLIPMIGAYYPFGPVTLSFGLGAGPYFSRSYESWEFLNSGGQKARLEIKKYYPISIGFNGRLGMDIRLSRSVSLMVESHFEAINMVMTQVDLTSYTLDGNEQIGNYDRTQITYNYARNVPDENKGGDALLAGFNFANYPQEKIGLTISLRIGISYNF